MNIDNTEMCGSIIMTIPISLAGLAVLNVPIPSTSANTRPVVESVSSLLFFIYRFERKTFCLMPSIWDMLIDYASIW